MKDRISTQVLANGAIRYAEYDANGNFVAYRYMLPADEPSEVGTPLNKATMLKDETAALFGLTNAVPDDVLAWLGNYALHCWHRKQNTIGKNDVTQRITLWNAAGTGYVNVSSSASIVNGEIVLDNPQTLTLTGQQGIATLVSMAPCYVTSSRWQGVLFLPQGIQQGDDYAYGISRVNGLWYISNTVTIGSSAQSTFVTIGEDEIVFSPNRNAYPDDGIQGDYYYSYVGIPFETAASRHIKIATGSYVGTGAYGATNTNSITVDFVPKLVFMLAATYRQDNTDPELRGAIAEVYFGSTLTSAASFVVSPKLLQTAYKAANYSFIYPGANKNVSYGKRSEDGKTIYWYYTADSGYQFNHQLYEYHWLAIG